MWQLIEQDPQFTATLAICAGLYCLLTIAWFWIDTPPKTHRLAPQTDTIAGAVAKVTSMQVKPCRLAPAPGLLAVVPGQAGLPAGDAAAAMPAASASSAHWNRLMSVLDSALESQVKVVRLQGDLTHKLDAADFEFDRMLEEVACYSSYAASRVAAGLAAAGQAEMRGAMRLAA